MTGTMRIGDGIARVEGRSKVTGTVRYTGDIHPAGMAYAVGVQSTVASGRIRAMDTGAAERAPGVLSVISHLNPPRLFKPDPMPRGGSSTIVVPAVEVFDTDEVRFAGQWVAVVVADTPERANRAAALIRVTYEETRPSVDLRASLDRAYRPGRINGNREPDTSRGDVEAGLREAAVRVDRTYVTPTEHHHPMELSAATAVWEGEGAARTLTLYDMTQAVLVARGTLARTFGIPEDRVRVVCEHLGGGFGGKVGLRAHSVLAAVAADRVGRPVQFLVSREQLFTAIGHRPASVQRIRLGAAPDGRLTAIQHDAWLQTSVHEEWVEQSATISRMLYACANRGTTHKAVKLNLATPTIMRGPGETPGSFAVESAMDELAAELGMDPIALRLRNDAESDPETGLPWSSRPLRACLEAGAARFGWAQRPAPRAMRDGRWLVGMGVAVAVRAFNLSPATVRMRLLPGGQVELATAAHDIGTGTYTFMAQIAAAVLGVPLAQVRVSLGDTRLPPSPPAGGSTTAASVSNATHDACFKLSAAIFEAARRMPASPLASLPDDGIEIVEGVLQAKAEPSRRMTLAGLLPAGSAPIEAVGRYVPPGREARTHSSYGFGAQFCEVRVDPDYGIVRVSRFLGVFDAGRILNASTARSQCVGAIVGGIGMALLEETVTDRRSGRYVNANLADYLIPVNADVPDIDVMLLDTDDRHVNPLGVKGIGELPMVGVAAAIANAVHHATGARMRDLPIVPERVLDVIKRGA